MVDTLRQALLKKAESIRNITQQELVNYVSGAIAQWGSKAILTASIERASKVLNTSINAEYTNPAPLLGYPLSVMQAIQETAKTFRQRINVTGGTISYAISAYGEATRLNPFFPYYEFGGSRALSYGIANTYMPKRTGGIFYFSPDMGKSGRRPGRIGRIFSDKSKAWDRKLADGSEPTAQNVKQHPTPALQVYRRANTILNRRIERELPRIAQAIIAKTPSTTIGKIPKIGGP